MVQVKERQVMSENNNSTDTSQKSESTEKFSMEASFSTLLMSIGSQAAIHLGLAPNPVSGQSEVDKDLARFNIDLLLMLQEKTKGNLSGEESEFLTKLIQDLQLQFVSK